MYSSFQAACLRRARMLTLGVRFRPMRLMAILRRIARLRAAPDAAVILPEGDIQHPVEPVFYGPMPADRLNQHCRIITAA